nr:hypothetical protein Y18D10A.14 - Caenorhabditis elegans [Caenorhabditis elegans]
MEIEQNSKFSAKNQYFLKIDFCSQESIISTKIDIFLNENWIILVKKKEAIDSDKNLIFSVKNRYFFVEKSIFEWKIAKIPPKIDLISSVNSTLREASFKANKVGITTIDKANFPTEEPLLELVHSCVSAVLQTQLRLCWSSLLSLFSEAPLSALSARAVFLLFV